MPVPTETFWNIRRLNLVFAVSAVALLASTAWLVFADYSRQWRGYQRQARVWQVAMTRDAQKQADYVAQARSLDELQLEIDKLSTKLQVNSFEQLGGKTLAQVQAEIDQAEMQLAKLRLPTATVKGELGPLTQRIERATLTYGKDSNYVAKLKSKRAVFAASYKNSSTKIAEYEGTVRALTAAMDAVQEQRANLQRDRDNAARTLTTVQERLAKLSPTGPAKIGKIIRDAPLMDWFNPTEKVQQVVVPQVRTDLNFLSVETIDRCTTCHINIEDPAFERSNLRLFVERQVALYQGQDVDSIDHPVVLADFWRRAAHGIGTRAQTRIQELEARTLKQINQLREQAGQKTLDSTDQLPDELDRIARVRDSADAPVRRRAWYQPLAHHTADLRQIVRDAVDDDQFEQLTDLYRLALTRRYNHYRQGDNLAPLDTSPVLLGHPKLDLFVGPESSHPIKTMGCTSCHEGSGQETQFEHTAHMPRQIWVDADSGAAVPEFLVAAAAGDDGDDLNAPPGPHRQGVTVRSGFSLDGATLAHASPPPSPDSTHTRYTHQDVKLTDPTNPAPFAPKYKPESHQVHYLDPSQPATFGLAIRQGDYWNKQFGWHAVHYMHWEKPMHRLEFIESSCNKCHTEIFDIKDQAPQLFKGRTLFSQLGCANCHTVESLQDDLDLKRVGPSLVHVKQKLSAPMMASWIWSPKGFRPMAKMPHYFMLENNSSPVDILRTRTEVAAMTHYLERAEPDNNAPAYHPETPPEHPGSVASGRALFNSVGCLACHTNMAETGEKWISQDLVDRTGATPQQAEHRTKAMSYNQQHWYALEHLGDKLQRTGPELSGVGTKLKTARTTEQARAWAYDWLRNPRHYSSYTIMPSFRLSPDQANDLAAYLLSLERPDYQAQNFGLSDQGDPELDESSTQMLAELAAQLSVGQGTLEMARDHVNSNMAVEDQLFLLGKKMISHYGCSSCHLINGFEQASATCATLDDWGLKDPHKLDFGYFGHAFDQDREHPTTVWKVAHEGLEADTPKLTADNHKKIQKVEIAWEHIINERRPWLYQKLHNPRVYDRGKTSFEGSLASEGDFTIDNSDVGRPYDKLKMPKFFLADQDVRALVTFVTSIRKPLIDPSLQQAAMGQTNMRLVRGRQLATLYNCYGCHNIEGNEPTVWQYMDVHAPNGGFDYEALNNAPPRLIGQGAKTQPDWLFGFLHNVHPLRPWLKIRMPSFPITSEHAVGLVDYFAASSQDTARRLADWLADVDDHRRARPDDQRWFANPRLAQSIERIKAFALDTDLVRPADLDERRTTPDERRATWENLVDKVRFVQAMTDIHYPFSETPASQSDPDRFARGEALFNELRCFQCHAMGDEQKLLALWKLDNPDFEAGDGFDDADDDGYDEYGDDEEGYGDDEGYGDEDEDPAPIGPVYSGPNLAYTATRLQSKWVDQWLQEPATIQPGTKMPQWFPGGGSAFRKFPGQSKDRMHAMYGFVGSEQRQLLLDFLYEAGRRNYTPGAERLSGTPTAKVELKPIAIAPAPDQAPATPTQAPDKQSVAPKIPRQAPTSDPQPAPVVEPVAEPAAIKSTITNFHDDPTAQYDSAGKARLIGQVSFQGKPPRRKPIRMSSDAFCMTAHKGTKVRSESVVVNKDRTVQNVFVYIKSGLPPGQKYDTPADPAVVDQRGCLYYPHVQGMMAGQSLKIINNDNTLHNVKMSSGNNGSFNEGMPVKGMVLDKVLSKPELKIPLKCDVHPWMSGYLYVMDHPFFSVTDVQGRFEITGLPPGQYTLEAIHENKKIPPVTIDVTIQPNTSHRTDLTIGAK